MGARSVCELPAGTIIRKYRTYQGLTLIQLGAIVGVHGNHLAKIERGEVIPGAGLLLRLAKALGVTTAHLMGEVPFLEPWPKEGTMI